MSSILYITNKTSGITYAYESHSYWDKEAKSPRTRRIYLGRVGEDGNIIPKKEKSLNKPSGSDDRTDYKKLYEQLKERNDALVIEIDSLKSVLASTQKALRNLSKLYTSQKECIEDMTSTIETVLKKPK